MIPKELGDILIEQLCLLWHRSLTAIKALFMMQVNPSISVNILGCMKVGGHTVAVEAERPYNT